MEGFHHLIYESQLFNERELPIEIKVRVWKSTEIELSEGNIPPIIIDVLDKNNKRLNAALVSVDGYGPYCWTYYWNETVYVYKEGNIHNRLIVVNIYEINKELNIKKTGLCFDKKYGKHYKAKGFEEFVDERQEKLRRDKKQKTKANSKQ